MERVETHLKLSAKEKTQAAFSDLVDKVEAVRGEERPYIKFGRKGKGIDNRVLLIKRPAKGSSLQARQWVAISAYYGILEATEGHAFMQGHSSYDDVEESTLKEVMNFFISSAETWRGKHGSNSFSRKISYENGNIILHFIEDHPFPDVGRITLKKNPHVGIKTLKEALMRSMSSEEAEKKEEIKPVRANRERAKAEKFGQYLSKLT